MIRTLLKKIPFIILDQRQTRGFHLLNDIRFFSRKASIPIQTIFDVGANVGQSIIEYKKYFPDSEIHAFEPIDETFKELQNNVQKFTNIYLNHFALSNKSESKKIYLSESSLTNSLLNEVETGQDKYNKTQVIQTETLESYFVRNKLEKIDLLKTDTEGFDVEVLKGAKHLLSNGYIKFIVTEVSFDPSNKAQTNFNSINEILWNNNFVLSSFYDYNYKHSSLGTLHYCNALYIFND